MAEARQTESMVDLTKWAELAVDGDLRTTRLWARTKVKGVGRRHRPWVLKMGLGGEGATLITVFFYLLAKSRTSLRGPRRHLEPPMVTDDKVMK
jgi:hypothetical protein